MIHPTDDCPADDCTLLVDVCHNTHTGGCPSANATFASETPIGGSAAAWQLNASVLDYGYFAAQGGGVWVHASANLQLFSGPAGKTPLARVSAGLWSNRAPFPPAPYGATAANDSSGSVGFWVSAPGPVRFEFRIGVSLVSVSGAARNLASEQRAPAGNSSWRPFQELRSQVASMWEAELGRVQVGAEVEVAEESTEPIYSPVETPTLSESSCPPPNFDTAYVAQVRAVLLLAFLL